MDSSYYQRKRKQEQESRIRSKYESPKRKYTPNQREYWEEIEEYKKPSWLKLDEENMSYYRKKEWHDEAPYAIAILFMMISILGIIAFLIILKIFGGL